MQMARKFRLTARKNFERKKIEQQKSKLYTLTLTGQREGRNKYHTLAGQRQSRTTIRLNASPTAQHLFVCSQALPSMVSAMI